MPGRPAGAVPPVPPANDHVPAGVGLDFLPDPDDSAPFPVLSLPAAATDGFELSGAELPDLPDFFL